ncbi:hypothetical protein A5761_04350 [Mycolicibacterium setense]|uniref:linalool dehydratase/isomerase domain-containing protein n=1 Tax=Mycolicibacterium setense TaxID=431269 RepID=UPI0007EB7932|nr:hypothetical protein [Mycolicibacterium setense]OBB20740.1 hypothetical protein A5761_04350 [Mycolicibacterium setense]
MTSIANRDFGLGVELAEVPALDDRQLGHLRHFENLATQLPGDWSKMGTNDPGQENVTAYRYQLALMTYALGLAHYHWLPAAPSAIKPTFEKLIDKMLRPEVWGYWRETSRGGRIIDPGLTELRDSWTDPVVKENIMYSGHLYAMAAMHAALFNDDRYETPGALTFNWALVFQGLGPESYPYQRSTLGDAIYWQMVENGWLGIACEPNCIFIVCNQYPLMGFRFEDLRTGGNRAQEATDQYRAAWSRSGMLGEDGSFHAFKMIRQDVFVGPGGVANDGWIATAMNSWNRAFIHEVFPKQLQGAIREGPDGTLSPYSLPVAAQIKAALAAGESAGFPEDLGHTWDMPSFGYLATGLSEVGDERLHGLLAHADRFMNPTWERGGLYYPRNDQSFDSDGNMTYMDPLTGNALIGYARLNVHNGLWALYNRPWTGEHFSQPRLESHTGAFDLRSAYYHADSQTLLLTARPRIDEATEITLTVDNTLPRPWTLAIDGVTVASDEAPDQTDTIRIAVQDNTLRLRTAITSETTLALRWA